MADGAKRKSVIISKDGRVGKKDTNKKRREIDRKLSKGEKE